MSRQDFRGGRAPLLTARQLSVLLPVPILMIIQGQAKPQFPASGPASPSPYVVVTQSRPRTSYPRATGLPLYIHWTQWMQVVVPLLEQATTSGWRGRTGILGDAITLMNNIVGPGGTLVSSVNTEIGFSAFTERSIGKLYGCERGSDGLVTYLNQMSGATLQAATDAGF